MQAQVEKELQSHLQRLTPSQQQRVVAFARTLAVSEMRGVPGTAVLRFGGTIDTAELADIARAITEDCERIDNVVLAGTHKGRPYQPQPRSNS